MTAIVRRMDNLGRVVIPKEMRTQLEMGPGTPMEIVGADDGIFFVSSRSCRCLSGCAACGRRLSRRELRSR